MIEIFIFLSLKWILIFKFYLIFQKIKIQLKNKIRKYINQKIIFIFKIFKTSNSNI
jgi:hypothetical protein